MNDPIDAKFKALLPDFMKTQALFVQDINWPEGWARVIESDREFFRNTVFLDERVLLEGAKGVKMHLKELNGLVKQQWDGKFLPCHFIFHLGHAGSTLISRMLDEIPDVFGMREPIIIRPIAIARNLSAAGKIETSEEKIHQDLQVLYLLLTRRFSPDEIMIMKTTSICANLSHDLIGFNNDNKGLVLSVSAEVNLANQMDKEQPKDIEAFSLHRLFALQKREPGIEMDLKTMSRAELIALNWMGEVVELYDLVTGPMKDRILSVDFDKFLNNKAAYVEKILKHFSLPGDAATVKRLTNSRVFDAYAKKPDFKYTAENRAGILTESRMLNHRKIKEGLALVEGLAKKFPSLKKAVDYFGLE